MAATACQKPRSLSLLTDLPGSDLKKVVDLMEITLKLIFFYDTCNINIDKTKIEYLNII